VCCAPARNTSALGNSLDQRVPEEGLDAVCLALRQVLHAERRIHPDRLVVCHRGGMLLPSLHCASGFVFAAVDAAYRPMFVEWCDSVVVHRRALLDAELDDVVGHQRCRVGLSEHQLILRAPKLVSTDDDRRMPVLLIDDGTGADPVVGVAIGHLHGVPGDRLDLDRKLLCHAGETTAERDDWEGPVTCAGMTGPESLLGPDNPLLLSRADGQPTLQKLAQIEAKSRG